MSDDELDTLAASHRLRIAQASLCPSCGAGPGMKCRRYVERDGTAYIEHITEPHAARFRNRPQA